MGVATEKIIQTGAAEKAGVHWGGLLCEHEKIGILIPRSRYKSAVGGGSGGGGK